MGLTVKDTKAEMAGRTMAAAQAAAVLVGTARARIVPLVEPAQEVA